MLSKIRKFIIDTLFPIECLGCKKDNVWLCDECLRKLSIRAGYFEPVDFSPSYIDGFLIASDWENKILQDAIHKFKYNFVQELAEPLSKLLIKKLLFVETRQTLFLKDFIIIPVPLHKKRYVWRGFNQAELLAQKVVDEFNLKLDNKLISRIKNTSPQVKLKSEARAENIVGVFNCRDAPVARLRDAPTGRLYRNYLLIDDVITTGATMNECGRILKQNGAEKVFGLALARG